MTPMTALLTRTTTGSLSTLSTLSALAEAAAVMSAVGLAAVLLAAAGFKTLDGEATALEFAALGLPRSAFLARAVPLFEVLTAALVLYRPRAGSAVALALLVVFTAVLARALVKGNRVSCGCFGALGRAPISRSTLARNGALMAVAAVAAGQATLTVPDIAAVIAVSTTALLVVVLTQLLSLGRRLGHVWSVDLAGEKNPMEVGSQ